ncbi:hypothetical protein [Gemmata sp.]|uniref:hypothetical protein n=1 Tax=Gemmata sp. TaxID=1914242 RepID=UPI003F720449
MDRKEVIVQDEWGVDLIPRQRTLREAADKLVKLLDEEEPGWVLIRVVNPPSPSRLIDYAWCADSALLG